MTTDNRTSEPTAGRLREMVANLIPLDLIHDRDRQGQPQDAFEAADRIIAALRAHNLLSEGAPTEAQVEAAAKAIADCHNPGMFEKYPENWRVEARAALTAAGVAAQGPRQNETKSGQDFVSLDPEKVGSIIDYYHDIPYGRRELIIDALCEAAKRGELS